MKGKVESEVNDATRGRSTRGLKTSDKASSLQIAVSHVSFLEFNFQLLGGRGPAGDRQDTPSDIGSPVFDLS